MGVGVGVGETTGILFAMNVPPMMLLTCAENITALLVTFVTVKFPAEIDILTASNMASSPV